MDTMRLQQVEGALRTAAQALWTYRTKDNQSPAVSSLLDSSQDALAELIEHVSCVRKMLDAKELD